MFVQEFLAKGGISNGMRPSEENFAHDVKYDGEDWFNQDRQDRARVGWWAIWQIVLRWRLDGKAYLTARNPKVVLQIIVHSFLIVDKVRNYSILLLI